MILDERDSAWVDVVDDMHWLNDGKEFLWVSERDGWRTHCICEGPGTTLHVYSLLTRYLLNNLPAGGR